METAVEGANASSTSYLWANGLVRQAKANGTAAEDLFPLKGHLNTSLGAVDANGNVAEVTNADAFGSLEQLAGNKQRHLYTGEHWDQDSQLTYLRARWYDPKIGQFVSADPFEGKQRNPRSLNRMAYAHNDPVHNSDPSGKESLMSFSTAFNALTVGVTSYMVTSELMAGNYGAAATELAVGLVAGKVGSWVASGGLTQFVVKNFGWLSKFTRNTRTITLYRAVGVKEYEALMRGEKLGLGPAGFAGKQFALTLEEALEFAGKSLNTEYVAVFKVVVEENAVKQLGQFSRAVDPWIFKNGVWTFAAEHLDALNKSIQSISHVF